MDCAETKSKVVPKKNTPGAEPVKLTKLAEGDDIEAYLTTFERVMHVAHIDDSTWAVKLAPQLTGKAQQAYAPMSDEDSAGYQMVKAAILKRYDISAERYRQRFRTTRRKDGESYAELVVRLQDLLRKWMTGCETIQAVLEKVAVEQALSTMPAELRIWVSERNPATSTGAGEMADNYLQVRQQTPKVIGDGEKWEK